MRQQFLTSATGALLLCILAALSAAGGTEHKKLYQTIPDRSGIYLPLVFRQDAPTPTIAPTATVAAPATAIPTASPTPTNGPRCDASYPAVCIPPPPPDLDCKDITVRRFRVFPPDPHGFDGDHDGIGCE